MKLYISVDLEGASGISSSEYVTKDGRLYNVGSRSQICRLSKNLAFVNAGAGARTGPYKRFFYPRKNPNSLEFGFYQKYVFCIESSEICLFTL